MLKAKIHRARVTESNLNYEGSITIDQTLMDAAGILPYEKVLAVNLANGARFESYAIPGPRGLGTICMNGGAARLAQVNDLVLIMTFGVYTEDALKQYSPQLIKVDDRNQIVEQVPLSL